MAAKWIYVPLWALEETVRATIRRMRANEARCPLVDLRWMSKEHRTSLRSHRSRLTPSVSRYIVLTFILVPRGMQHENRISTQSVAVR